MRERLIRIDKTWAEKSDIVSPAKTRASIRDIDIKSELDGFLTDYLDRRARLCREFGYKTDILFIDPATGRRLKKDFCDDAYE